MPYIGRDLNRGNYLKLDDISSSFNSSTKTFNLTVGGSAFTPGSAFSILVSIGGVIQEPESAYQVNNSEITFANAPTAQDGFFCIALGVPLSIGVPGNGTVNGTQLAKPFNYDGYFHLDHTNNRVGINSSSPTVALDVIGDINLNGNLLTGIGGTLGGTLIGNVYAASGISTFNDLLVNGNLTVEGDTTTLNTTLRNVELLRVSAASTLPAGIITQTSTGDILSLYDSANEVFKVTDGGVVKLPKEEGQIEATGATGLTLNASNSSAFARIRVAGDTRLHIKSDGNVGIGTTNADSILHLQDSNHGAITLQGGTATSDLSLDFQTVAGVTTARIFSASDAGDLRFYTANNENLRIQADGTVGINNSSPNNYFKLDVNGNANINGTLALPTANRLYFGTSDVAWIKGEHGGSGYLEFGVNTAHMWLTRAGRLGIGTASPSGKLDIVTGASGGNVLIDAEDSSAYHAKVVNDSGDLTLGSRNTSADTKLTSKREVIILTGSSEVEKLRIKSDGDVGINSTSPREKLDVSGGRVILDPGYQLTWATGTTNRVRIHGDSGSNFIVENGSSNVERLRIDSSGNITNTGIATSFVTHQFAANFAKLDLRGTNIANSNHYILSYGAGHANDQEFHMVNTLGALVFRTGSSSPTERLRINAAGKVLVGSGSTDASLLNVKGSAGFADDGTNAGIIISTDDANGAGIHCVTTGGFANGGYGIMRLNASQHKFSYGNTERLLIDSSGRVKIGGTAVSQNRNLVIGSNAEANLAIETHNDAASEGANIRFYKSRGTAASPTSVADDHIISQFLFYGHDGNDFAHPVGVIRAKVNGTPQTNQMPGELSFHTNHGDTYATERLKIQANGRITMGEANFDASNDLHIRKGNDGGDVAIRITNNSGDNSGTTASLYFTTSPTQDFNTAYIQAVRQGGRLNFGYSTNAPTVSFKVSTNQVGINTDQMSSGEYLTLRPSGNTTLDIAYKLNGSNDIRHKYYDSGGTWRGGFGFTEYANNSDFPNYHDSFYWQTHNGTSLRTAMRMNNEGVLVRPYHPAFHWRKDAGQTYDTSWATIGYADKIFDRGTAIQGSDMVSSSVFTAPVTGIYFFHADANVVAFSGGAVFYMAFFLNGNQYSRTMFSYNQQRKNHHIDMIIEMQEGDTVDARAKISTGTVSGDNDGKFFGYLIG